MTQKFSKLSKPKKHLLYYVFNNAEDKNIEFLRDYIFTNIDSNLSFQDFEKKILKLVGKLDTEEQLIIDKNIDNKNMSKMFDAL
ncbi:MAG: hypothetical protein PF487_14880 [Bacteroidales bacterium]|nr:hypothetical protein [Bacteroidales bacterium]